MIRTNLIFLLLVILSFILIGSQKTFAQADPIGCFFSLGDCDGDGVLDIHEEANEKEDPCKPSLINTACFVRAWAECKPIDYHTPRGFSHAEDRFCKAITNAIEDLNQRRIDLHFMEIALDAGYEPLFYPGVPISPGTVIHIREDTDSFGIRKIDIICRPRQILGEDFEAIISPARDFEKKAGAQIVLDWSSGVGIEEVVNIDAKGQNKELSSFSLSVRNMNVANLALADVYKQKVDSDKLKMKKECQSAIDDFLDDKNKKGKLTFIDSIISGNVGIDLRF